MSEEENPFLPELEEFEGELQINKHALDDDMVVQPDIVYRVSKAYSEAKDARDTLYSEMNEVYANVELDIRNEYAESGEKITEPKIKSMVVSSEEYQEAQKEYLNAKYWASRLGDLKDSFQQKSYMLREMVQLYMANYFSDTAVDDAAEIDNENNYRTAKNRMRDKRNQS